MAESINTRVARAYKRGQADALREAALDTKARGDVGQPGGPTVPMYLASRADDIDRYKVPEKQYRQ